MNHSHKKLGLALILSISVTHALAADLEAGKEKSAICQGCHGADGVSTYPVVPSLAGQNAVYIESQLNSFKLAAREHEVMKKIASGLSAEDMSNLALYFSSLPAKAAGGEAEYAAQGKPKVAMCMGCHGENLLGHGYSPRLAGQQPQYLVKQLQHFNKGTRIAGVMNAIARNLSTRDMTEIAAYIANVGK